MYIYIYTHIIYIYIYVYIYISRRLARGARAHARDGCGRLRDAARRGLWLEKSAPHLPTNIYPNTEIAWVKLSRKFPIDMMIPPLNIKIMLGSNPLKSIISVRRLAVTYACAAGWDEHRACHTSTRTAPTQTLAHTHTHINTRGNTSTHVEKRGHTYPHAYVSSTRMRAHTHTHKHWCTYTFMCTCSCAVPCCAAPRRAMQPCTPRQRHRQAVESKRVAHATLSDRLATFQSLPCLERPEMSSEFKIPTQLTKLRCCYWLLLTMCCVFVLVLLIVISSLSLLEVLTLSDRLAASQSLPCLGRPKLNLESKFQYHWVSRGF